MKKRTILNSTLTTGAAAIFLGIVCCNAYDGRSYRGIPDSPEFPLPQGVIQDFVKNDDVPAMRRHAWRLFRELNQSLTVDGVEVPRWATWYDATCVFEQKPCSPGALFFEQDPQVSESAGKPVPSVVLYNRELRNFVVRFTSAASFRKLYEQGQRDLGTLADQFPGANKMIAVKTDWRTVPAAGSLDIGVWDSERQFAGDANNGDTTWPRRVCVADSAEKCRKSVWPWQPVQNLYNLKIKDAAMLQDVRGIQGQQMDCAQPDSGCSVSGDYLILTSFHFATREQANWVWATFWWHDRPGQGQYAADRPSVLESPWSHYLMNVAYDMDKPREPDGTPHIAFNPGLEGGQTDGVVSNCMTCHHRATWSPKRATCIVALTSDGGTLSTVSVPDIVVRGKKAAEASYLNEPFGDQLQLSFLWSLRRAKPDGKELPPEACE